MPTTNQYTFIGTVDPSLIPQWGVSQPAPPGSVGDEVMPAPWTINVVQPSLQVQAQEFLAAQLATAKKASMGLDKRVRDCFRVHNPKRLDLEIADAYFEAQDLRITHPYNFPDRKSLIGIEVEVENVMKVDPNVLLAAWMMVEDHSLRNYGREFKTVALPIGYAQQALAVLFRGLNSDIDFSARTSIHVHQDVRGLSLNELLSLLFTYVCVEHLFFKFAGNNRKTSIYCVPILSTMLFEQLRHKKQLVANLGQIQHWWPKYSALNLQPVSSFGTVEYRHLPGTNNIGKILIWIDLISRLKLWAYKNSFDSVVERISDLNTNSQYAAFLNDVFGSAAQYLDTSDLLHDMEEGVTAVRNCVISNDFHNGLRCASDSPLARSCGRRPTCEFLTAEQEEAWQIYAKRWWPNDNHDELYHTVKRRLADYMNHGGKEGSALLRIVFPKGIKV